MSTVGADPIEAFYERHPYPPPVAGLGPLAHRLGDERAVRAAHHRAWPGRPVDSIGSVLVAGCGTSQAVRHALRRPAAQVVGIDVSAASLAHTRALAASHGVAMLQAYCRRLGVGTTPAEIADLVATLRELPLGHPLGRLLREARDFADDDALADALCSPRERTYDVPELVELIEDAGLRFGRWERQAPYLPDCGTISETPHAARIAALPTAEQYALVELFRGTIARHTVIAHHADDPGG